jgi:hypothetical protein
MKGEEAKRLTQLEKENARLKRQLVEAELDKAMLKDLAEGNFRGWNVACGPSRSCRSITGHPSGASAAWWVNTAAHRHPTKFVSIEEVKLHIRLREIATEHIRSGWRMAYRLLRREGWTANHRWVHRLWRD